MTDDPLPRTLSNEQSVFFIVFDEENFHGALTELFRGEFKKYLVPAQVGKPRFAGSPTKSANY